MNYRKGNAVRRYHTLNILVEETVGHHSANVAMLCDLLANHQPSANLLKAALYHDLAEQYTGDIPATAKWQWPMLKDCLEIIENSQLPTIVLTELEQRILKQADMLDLCYKCDEELRMGNTNVLPIFHRGIKWLAENEPLPITESLMEELIHG